MDQELGTAHSGKQNEPQVTTIADQLAPGITDQAVDRLKDLGRNAGEAVDRVRDLGRNAPQYLRARPMQTALAVLFLGCLAGALLYKFRGREVY